MTPACAKACPTQSIQYGTLTELHQKADARLATLKAQGYDKAQLYGRDDSIYGGLGAFFLLMDKPEVYGLSKCRERGLTEPQQLRRLRQRLRRRGPRRLRGDDGVSQAESG